MSDVDVFMEEAEFFLNVLEMSDCPIALPRRDCLVLRAKPRYYSIIKRDLLKIGKRSGWNIKSLKTIFKSNDVRSIFKEPFGACPSHSYKCFRGFALTSPSTKAIKKYYSVDDIEKDILKGRLSLKNAPKYLPLETQMILSVILELPRGYYTVGLQTLKSDISWRYHEEFSDESLIKACRPLERLGYIQKTRWRGLTTYRLIVRSARVSKKEKILEALVVKKTTHNLINKLKEFSGEIRLDK